MIKFSIILPTYNVGLYIDRCLTSCVNQTYTYFEVIVVDDCGQDDAIEKAKHWTEKDSRIKIVHHKKNLGTYHARHTGVKAAKGEYIVFLDPDDTLELNALEELNKLISTKPDMLLFGYREIPEKKIYQVQTAVPKVNEYRAKQSDIKKLLSPKGFNIGTPGKAYSKNIISKAFSSLNVPVTMRLIYGEDVLLFSEALLKAKSIKSTQEKVYLYHQEKTSITKVNDYEAILRNMEQLNYVINRLKEKIVSDSRNNIIAKIIKVRLSADLLALENKTDISFFNKIKNYIALSLLTRNFRWLIKATLFIITFGRKAY